MSGCFCRFCPFCPHCFSVLLSVCDFLFTLLLFIRGSIFVFDFILFSINVFSNYFSNNNNNTFNNFVSLLFANGLSLLPTVSAIFVVVSFFLSSSTLWKQTYSLLTGVPTATCQLLGDSSIWAVNRGSTSTSHRTSSVWSFQI